MLLDSRGLIRRSLERVAITGRSSPEKFPIDNYVSLVVRLHLIK
jgi:hypothetical protein